MDAINLLTHTHGVIATNNNSGVTLESTDGRNMSVWFDGSGVALASGTTVALTVNGLKLRHKQLRVATMLSLTL